MLDASIRRRESTAEENGKTDYHAVRRTRAHLQEVYEPGGREDHEQHEEDEQSLKHERHGRRRKVPARKELVEQLHPVLAVQKGADAVVVESRSGADEVVDIVGRMQAGLVEHAFTLYVLV